jgi:hypothetical protein
MLERHGNRIERAKGEFLVATPAPESNERRGRPLWRLTRALAFVLLAAALTIAAAPYLIAYTPLRNALLGAIFKDLNGTITATSARLGWFSPIIFRGLEIRPPLGPPILTIVSFSGDLPLWRIALLGDDWGHFRCESPSARIAVADRDSNFKRVFERPKKPHEAGPLVGVPRASASLQVIDGSISLTHVEGDLFNPPQNDPGRWQARGISFSAGIRRAGGAHPALLYVEPGKLLDHASITRDVAHAWLQYVAPVLAGATETEGSFSIDLDEWQVPLDTPQKADLGGRLTIHSLDVTPGPVGRVISEFLHLPATLVASQESVVRFQMHDGRVHHRDLQFVLGGLPVTTRGSVGLDQSLELTANVTLPRFQNEEAPFRHALSGRTLAIPIRGTLHKPQIDSQALARTGVDIANDVLANLAQRLGRPPTVEDLPPPSPQNDGEQPSAGDGAVDWENTIRQAIPVVEEILRNRLQRRRERQQQAEGRAATEPPPDAQAQPPSAELPQRGLLRRGVRRLLDALAEPPPGDTAPPRQPPPEPVAPAPAPP